MGQNLYSALLNAIPIKGLLLLLFLFLICIFKLFLLLLYCILLLFILDQSLILNFKLLNFPLQLLNVLLVRVLNRYQLLMNIITKTRLIICLLFASIRNTQRLTVLLWSSLTLFALVLLLTLIFLTNDWHVDTGIPNVSLLLNFLLLLYNSLHLLISHTHHLFILF